MIKHLLPLLRVYISALILLILASCGSVQFQSVPTIEKVDEKNGYRLNSTTIHTDTGHSKNMLMMMAFSGGGSRAAALGYGVLEEMSEHKVPRMQGKNLTDEVDIVFGISGGSVLAAYYGLHGSDTVPTFEKRFLQQNLQKILIRQLFAVSNWPRLTSPEFGRGDLLEEEMDRVLFQHRTYGDLLYRRKGPFAIISATDMSLGARLDFTQDYFDMLCLDLTALPISRAVAASSSVPLVFAPITLNNWGGHCAYQPFGRYEIHTAHLTHNSHRLQTRREFAAEIASYQNSEERPFIHLIDGGLTDNLGLRSMLDVAETHSRDTIYDKLTDGNVDKIVLIHVNAQNRMATEIDKSAMIPQIKDVLRSVIDIPIDRYSQETLRQFRRFVDDWQKKPPKNKNGKAVDLYFISLNLTDVSEHDLRERVLNIPTSFYLLPDDIARLKKAARTLLNHSSEYQRLLRHLDTDK